MESGEKRQHFLRVCCTEVMREKGALDKGVALRE